MPGRLTPDLVGSRWMGVQDHANDKKQPLRRDGITAAPPFASLRRLLALANPPVAELRLFSLFRRVVIARPARLRRCRCFVDARNELLNVFAASPIR